jgi:starch phosphorylase
LQEVLDSLVAGEFSPDDPWRYAQLVEAWRGYDRYMVAADFDAYWNAQREVDRLWQSPKDWWRKSILNTAHMAWFSSDRTIREYAEDIWRVPAV